MLCGLAFGLALLIAPDTRPRRRGLRWILGAIVVLVAVPWFLYMWWRFGQAFIEGYVLRENVWLYARPLYRPSRLKLLFYLRTLPVGLLSWTPLLIGRLIDILRGDRCSDEKRLLWAWAIAVTGFFTFSPFQYDRYLYPIVPALCLIAAHAWHRLREAELHAQIGAALGAIVTAAGVVISGMALMPLLSRVPLDISRWIDLLDLQRSTIASTYGRMTLSTRQIRAKRIMSSMLARLYRRTSRSASIATSRPTLLRYLKQSATVLAGTVIGTCTPSIE